jgi:membrane associated rhomboid family serine protease
MAAIYYWSTTRFPAARQLGIMDSGAVAAGQWWRLFTAVSLHENMPHLMANVTTGFVLLGLAMARYGAGVGLLASFIAGAAGNVAGLALYPQPHEGLGASGMVMGALGLITAQSFAFWRACRSASHFWLRSLAAGVLILVLIGFSPESDIVAHVGGFVCGLLCGWALGHARAETLQGGAANLAASTAVVALLVATWHMALRAP